MSILGEVFKVVGSAVAKTGVIVIKEGYQFGKCTGEGVIKGTVKGTAAIVKEVVKKSTGN